MQELVVIARIAKPRGLRGELVADVLTDFPERFDGLEAVIAAMPTGGRLDLKIEDSWFQKGRIVLKFEGYDSVESAEALRNAEICVVASEAVELEDDEFFDWELIDCRVETVDGEKIGRVREVMRTGGTEVLIVANEEKEVLIPFAKTICVEVDVDKKLIRIDPPEGLLDF